MGNVFHWNSALLTKWLWRFLLKREDLWPKVIAGIHEVKRNGTPQFVTVNLYGVHGDGMG